MIMHKIISWVLIFGVIGLFAIELDVNVQQPSIKKDFLIVKSTKSYQDAENFAIDLAAKTNVKYLRDKHYNKELGLSQEKTLCEDAGFEYPCYFSRGRYDDGIYISLEYSNAYGSFAKGYFLVMIASGKYAKPALVDMKTYVPDAYVKHSSVYLGCMH